MNWQTIETAPKDREILAWGMSIGHLVVEFDEAADPGWPWSTLDGPNYHRDAFTHWMPLPDPPVSP